MTYLYLHGFASGPGSFKAQYLKQEIKKKHDVHLIIPDLNTPSFQEMTITSQLEYVAKMIEDIDDELTLFGSSMGAFICLLLEEQFSERIKSMTLLAPAFNFYSRFMERINESQYEQWKKDGFIELPHYSTNKNEKLNYSFLEDAKHYENKSFNVKTFTEVIHGFNDEVIPYSLTKKYLGNQKMVNIKYVNDDHSLHKSIEMISF